MKKRNYIKPEIEHLRLLSVSLLKSMSISMEGDVDEWESSENTVIDAGI